MKGICFERESQRIVFEANDWGLIITAPTKVLDFASKDSYTLYQKAHSHLSRCSMSPRSSSIFQSSRIPAVSLLLLTFVLPSSRSIAQWQWQNPLPQGNSLAAVRFTNSQSGWACGEGGTILKTTNNGGNWQVRGLPLSLFALDIFFVNEELGWVCGEYNSNAQEALVFRTTNGGNDWQIQLGPIPNQTIKSLFFLNSRTGWAGVGSRLFRTTDEGQSWQQQQHPEIDPLIITSIAFSDTLHGWAVAKNFLIGNDMPNVLRTSNGGTEWVIDSSITWASKVVFIDNLEGWAAGQRKIGHTTDGGQTWTTQLDEDLDWADMSFATRLQGFAVSGPSIVRTTNGGTTWEFLTNPSNRELSAIACVDNGSGIAVGVFGTLLRTSNGGSTWVDQRESATDAPVLDGMHFLDSSRGWISGWGGTMVKTTNGGGTWFTVATNTTARLRDVYFTSENSGWAVGTAGTILFTQDGGSSWSLKSTPWTTEWEDLEFRYYPVGWMVGGNVSRNNRRMIKTTDGGDTWNEITNVVIPEGKHRVVFTSISTGWLMSGNSTAGGIQQLQRTTNAGASWTLVLSHANSDTAYDAMHFLNDSIGWVSTTAKILFATTTGGQSWHAFQTPEEFYSLFFVTLSIGWGGSFLGGIYYTSDGGANWVRQLVSPEGVTRIQMLSPSLGWACGFFGAILSTSNGGHSTFVEQPITVMQDQPDLFVLEQNFPNPFNSETILRIRSRVFSHFAEVAIYDIIGRELDQFTIAPIVAGSNSLVWNALDAQNQPFSSGVYLVRVSIRGITRSQKILLIR